MASNDNNNNNNPNDEEKKMDEIIDKKKGKSCYICGEEGHLKRDCPKNTEKDKGGRGKRPNYAERFVKPLSMEEEQKLDKARIESLPEKLDNYDILHIYVDGYNIIGCDKICRNFMYKSKNTKNKARERLIILIQELFVEKIKLKLNYGLSVHVWFDGHIDKEYTLNNKSIENYKDIEITHTPINYVVDDKLVDQFSKISPDKNGDKLVVTADRELTIRLFDIGVLSMKSGKFYKQFLKEEKEENQENQEK